MAKIPYDQFLEAYMASWADGDTYMGLKEKLEMAHNMTHPEIQSMLTYLRAQKVKLPQLKRANPWDNKPRVVDRETMNARIKEIEENIKLGKEWRR